MTFTTSNFKLVPRDASQGPASAARDEAKLECCCGRLLFKLTAQGIELKCPRCRHVVKIARQELLAAYKDLEARDQGIQSPQTGAESSASQEPKNTR